MSAISPAVLQRVDELATACAHYYKARKNGGQPVILMRVVLMEAAEALKVSSAFCEPRLQMFSPKENARMVETLHRAGDHTMDEEETDHALEGAATREGEP